MYQIPPSRGGANGSGVQDDLQTRCRSSIQPSQKVRSAPSFIGVNMRSPSHSPGTAGRSRRCR